MRVDLLTASQCDVATPPSAPIARLPGSETARRRFPKHSWILRDGVSLHQEASWSLRDASPTPSEAVSQAPRPLADVFRRRLRACATVSRCIRRRLGASKTTRQRITEPSRKLRDTLPAGQRLSRKLRDDMTTPHGGVSEPPRRSVSPSKSCLSASETPLERASSCLEGSFAHPK